MTCIVVVMGTEINKNNEAQKDRNHTKANLLPYCDILFPYGFDHRHDLVLRSLLFLTFHI